MNEHPRRRVRRWLALTALVFVVVAGLLIGLDVLSPSLLDVFGYPRGDDLLVVGYCLVALFAGSLLLVPLYLEPADAITNAEGTNASPHEPEGVPDVPRTGATLEPLLGNPLLGRHLGDEEREAIRTRLREAALGTIRRRTGVERDDATARLRHGDWTENATAAWFLGDTSPPRSVRLYARVSASHAFRHGARRTIDEIVAYDRRHESRRTHRP